MNVAVVLEQRFEGTPDGAVWTNSACSYRFWVRYLDVFSMVRVAARVLACAEPPAGAQRADGENVRFVAVPHFLGPWQYLLRRGAVRRSVRAAPGPADAVVLRIPSTLAAGLQPLLHRQSRPYGVELVGDPYDAFAPGAVRSVARPLARAWFIRNTRRLCSAASAVAYVTRQTLQRRFPAGAGAFTTHYSSVELAPEAFVAQPRSPRCDAQRFTLVFVGSLAQLYKSPDVVIDAVARCVGAGMDLHLEIIGDGRHRLELEQRAAAAGLSERVRFWGQLPPGEPVRQRLDAADLLVLPSRTEGLPRAMIEAMARGLPCIGSSVGGFPELLVEEDLVPPGNIAALVEKFREVLGNPRRLGQMSARNLEKAGEYRDELLAARRREFYRHVRRQTEQWLAGRGR